MKILVVHAHPVGDSFSHALFEATKRGLVAGGHTVSSIDLYAEGFGAAMTVDERAAYHSDTPLVSPDVTKYAEMVKTTEGLVFVYPTWWAGFPAVLKGWLDRVMVPGVIFDVVEVPTGHKIVPILRGIRLLAGVTTYGSPWWYVKSANDAGRRTIMRALRLNFALRCKRTWLALYKMDTRTPADRERFLIKVERKMALL